ncbi:MAG: hypothetical protein FLDDKLPJ_00086 [Phycisphaerae bacterium]|nr:hypothetical protein [Phycisphaerae bacterium]
MTQSFQGNAAEVPARASAPIRAGGMLADTGPDTKHVPRAAIR